MRLFLHIGIPRNTFPFHPDADADGQELLLSGAAPPQMATGHATSAGRSGDRKVTSRESGAEFTQPASEIKRPVVYALFAAVAVGAPVHYYTSAGCADDDR